MEYSAGSIENRYVQLLPKRQPYLDRARESALYTIPHLVPPQGTTGSTNLPTPYQSVGSDGINNLAAKLLLSQLPPNNPFFRLTVDDAVIAPLVAQDPNYKFSLDATLSATEQSVQKYIDSSGDRAVVFEGFKQLLVAGNVLFFFPYKDRARAFKLDTYVVRRDPGGSPLEIITKECVSYTMLPDEVKALICESCDVSEKDTATVDVYTSCRRINNVFVVSQEVRGFRIPGGDGQYPLDKCPYLPLRFTVIDGEAYGRGFVEEYLGDLHALDGESRALLEASIASARVIPMVSPNGTLRMSDLQKPNGVPIQGDATDLHFAQIGKQADLSVTMQHISVLERRLGQAFLLMSGIQRDAERVTAEEIRAVIEQLDTRMGGFYSVLAQDFQLPYVKIKMHQMQKQGLAPRMPDNVVQPTIITGLQALGRGQDLAKLKEWVGLMQQLLGPAFSTFANVDVIGERVAASMSFDATGLLKTQEEVQQQTADAQNSAVMQKMAGPAVNQLGSMASQMMQQQ